MTTQEEAIWLSRGRRPPAAFDGLARWSLWQRRTAWLILGMTVLRLVAASQTGLTDTEAYYSVWARFPAWSYYDHPPLLAWIMSATTLTSRSAFAIRLGPVLCSAVFAALTYRLGARLFSSARAGFLAVLVIATLPAFLFVGFVANPEGPLAALWALYLLLLDDLRRHRQAWRPLLLGAVIGVAFLAKYTALLAVPVTLLFVAVSPGARHWLRGPWLYLGGVVALVIASPVIVWNYQHDWPSIALHLVERMPSASAATFASNALRALTGQLVLFQPLAFPGLLAMLGVTMHRGWRDERYRLLAVTSAPVLLFFFAAMTRACDAEPHWTMVGYVPLAIAAGGWIDERLDRRSGSKRYLSYLRGCVVLTGVVAALCAIHVATPAFLRLVPASAYDADADPSNEMLGWDGVREAIADESSRLGPGAVVVSHHNVLCGHLTAAIDDQPPVYCVSPRRTEFDFIGRRTPPAGAPVIYVESSRYPAGPAAVLPERSCARAKTVDVERGGRVVNEMRIYECPPEMADR